MKSYIIYLNSDIMKIVNKNMQPIPAFRGSVPCGDGPGRPAGVNYSGAFFPFPQPAAGGRAFGASCGMFVATPSFWRATAASPVSAPGRCHASIRSASPLKRRAMWRAAA